MKDIPKANTTIEGGEMKLAIFIELCLFFWIATGYLRADKFNSEFHAGVTTFQAMTHKLNWNHE